MTEKLYERFMQCKSIPWLVFKKIYYKLYLRTSEQVCQFLKCGGATIGENVHIGSPSILGTEPYLVSIGDNTYFSGNETQLITHEGAIMQLFHMEIVEKKYDVFGRISIGKNCFIGTRCIVLKNVTIGDNCIIGAGSIVTKDIPANSVACGVPAKVIGTVEDFHEKNRKAYFDTFGMNFAEKKAIVLKEFREGKVY